MNIFAKMVSLYFGNILQHTDSCDTDALLARECVDIAEQCFSDDDIDMVNALEWLWVSGFLWQYKRMRSYGDSPFLDMLEKMFADKFNRTTKDDMPGGSIDRVLSKGFQELTEYFKPRYLRCLAFCGILNCHEDEAIYLFISSMAATPQKINQYVARIHDGAQLMAHDKLSIMLTGHGLTKHGSITKYDIFQKYRLYSAETHNNFSQVYQCNLRLLPVYLSENEPVTVGSFLKRVVIKTPKSTLCADDFEHMSNIVNMLRGLKARSIPRVCIHGRAGTGKTEFVRWAAREIWTDGVYQVDDAVIKPNISDRLTLIVLLGYMLPKNAVMVVDEMDVLLNTPDDQQRLKVVDRRAELLSILDDSPCSTIWIGNKRPSDEAVRRRMSLVFEMPVLPTKQRQKLIKKLGGFDEKLAKVLATVDRVTPAVLTVASNMAHACADQSEHARLEAVKLTIDGICSKTHDALVDALSERIPEYDPTLVNSEVDYTQILEKLRQKPIGSFLFHGISGTGKTEFANQLSRDLDVPIVALTGADTVSAFVGKTEQNIKEAFQKAKSTGAILLINEAETFLRARDSVDPTRSPWLIDRANEMLNQMEVFDGIVIATLNNHDMLDRAFLRRFDITTEFKGLLDDQICKYLSSRFSYKFSSDPAVWQTILRRENITSPVTVGMLSKLLRSDRFKDYLMIGDVIADLKTLASDLSPDAKNSVGFIQQTR